MLKFRYMSGSRTRSIIVGSSTRSSLKLERTESTYSIMTLSNLQGFKIKEVGRSGFEQNQTNENLIFRIIGSKLIMVDSIVIYRVKVSKMTEQKR